MKFGAGVVGGLLIVGWVAGARAEEAPACQREIDDAVVATRSAQYEHASTLYERAAGASAWCQARAQAGMAEVWNSRGNTKKAIAASESALAATDDPVVLSVAYHQLGRALFRKGQRAGQRTDRAADALRRAVELTEGRNEAIVHALARLYRETKQTDALASLVAAYPDVKLWTREDQAALFRRATSPCMKPTGPGYWAQELPRFAVRTGPTFPELTDLADLEDEGETDDEHGNEDEKTADEAEDATPTAAELATMGFERPRRLEGKAPAYTDVVRRGRVQGVARLEALVTKEGTIERVRILRGLDPALVRSAQEVMCAWTFEVLEIDGEPSPFYLQVEADFRLE